MAEKKFIIHSDAYVLGKDRIRSDKEKTARDIARARWDEALLNADHPVIVGWEEDPNPDKEGDVYDYRDGDVYKVVNYVNPGDQVVVCGAYRDVCADAAAQKLYEAGIQVSTSISDDSLHYPRD